MHFSLLIIKHLVRFHRALVSFRSIVPKLQVELAHGSSVTEELFYKENNVKKLQNLFDQM